MIANSELRDDLDSYKTNYNPKGKHFVISMPFLDEKLFETTNSDDHNEYTFKFYSNILTSS